SERIADLVSGDRSAVASQPVAARARDSGEETVSTEAHAVLRREGEYWTIAYGGDPVRGKNTKGPVCPPTLVRHPGQGFHVLDLAGGEEVGPSPGTAEVAEAGLSAARLGDAGEVLDAAARGAYKRRLQELGEEIEEAERFNDRERAARLKVEVDALVDELSRGIGLGGRGRKSASIPERARLNVTRAIGVVLKKI